MIKPRIKICCIQSVEEAQTAIRYGASALGLVGEMPSGPGVITDELIYQISRRMPPPISTFLLTSETHAGKIIAHHRKTLTSAIQIVDAVSSDTYASLREAIPAIKLVQVVHVINDKSVDEAVQVSEMVDAILLDSGNPNLKVKELGGTGRIHNWKLSNLIRRKVKVPVFLAGGLTPENVKLALEEVEPFGIDVCNGVRTNGKLDEEKLELFMQNALNYQ